MQVVSLTTHKVCCPRQADSRLRIVPSVRHLDLKTRIDVLLKNLDMPAFPQLETLELRAWTPTIHPYDSIDLDLTGVQSLRHLHIENWVPKSIDVTSGCRVHAVWHYHKARYSRELDWLDSPCWSNSDTALASLTFHAPRIHWDIAVDAIYRIMECQVGLEFLEINAHTYTLGWKEVPFTIPSQCNDGLRAPLRIEIWTRRGCYLKLDDTPLGKAVVLKIKGPIFIATPGASNNLHWYTLKSRPASRVDKGYMSLRWQPAEAQGSAKSPVIVVSRDAAGHCWHAADLNASVICGSFSKFLSKFYVQILLLVLVSLCMGIWLRLSFASSFLQEVICRGSGLFESGTELLIASKAALCKSLSSWKSMQVSEICDLLLELVDFYLELVEPMI